MNLFSSICNLFRKPRTKKQAAQRLIRSKKPLIIEFNTDKKQWVLATIYKTEGKEIIQQEQLFFDSYQELRECFLTLPKGK
jgi:hypothetical protein